MKILTSENLKALLTLIKGKMPKKTSELTNDSDFQTKTQVDAAIKKVVGTAPEALDTLGEIADFLKNDTMADGLVKQLAQKVDKTDYDNLANSVTGVNDSIRGLNSRLGDLEATDANLATKGGALSVNDAADKYVAKVTGKGLSTKDYSAADQTKLADLPTRTELDEMLDGKQSAADLETMTAAEIEAVAAEVWGATA